MSVWLVEEYLSGIEGYLNGKKGNVLVCMDNSSR
jgi:hypothetical protein